jgi:hypothetical protein
MGSSQSSDPELTGSLYLTPFKGTKQQTHISERVAAIAETAEGPQIDVVTRFPQGVTQVEEATDSDPTSESQSLSIQTLSAHALDSVKRCTENMGLLSVPAENALLVEHAEAYQWDTEYLQSASTQDTFHQDLRSFVSDAIRYPDHDASADPVVAELFAFTDSFFEFLTENGYIPREAVVRVAVETFRDQGVPEQLPADAVLATEFTEFTAVERQYLAYLTQDADFLMIRRPPRSTPRPSSAASDVYKRQA